MKITRPLGMIAILVAIIVVPGPDAFADDAGWYTGFNVGQSRAKIDDARIAGGLLGDGFTTTSIDNDDRHFGFKAFGGYEFNRYFALESGYFDLGKFGFTADTLPAGSLRGEIIGRVRVAHDRRETIGRDVDALDLIGLRAQLARTSRRQSSAGWIGLQHA